MAINPCVLKPPKEQQQKHQHREANSPDLSCIYHTPPKLSPKKALASVRLRSGSAIEGVAQQRPSVQHKLANTVCLLSEDRLGKAE